MGESSKKEEEIKLSAGKREGAESGNGNTHPPLSLSAGLFFVRVVYFLFYMPFFKAPFLVIPFFPAEKIFWEAFPFPYKIAQRSY